MSASSAIVPGQSIGKYEVIKHLATGGMAEIYLARVGTLPGLEKLVVLKRILPELASRDDIVQMFVDEARIATMLDHPNVVQTFDAGVVDGKPFLAMEYLHGEPVSALMPALIRQGERLPLEHALTIVIGVLAGLHYAHEKVGFDGRALNIVHRDVTPQNVIVTYDGGVKLVDFGIARSAQRIGRTRYGTIKGKVPYMSPEQCQGEPLDRRSDLFSVGIMLYELTLGRRLFRGKGDYDVLKQIVESPVTPPRQIDPGYDAALEAIVMRALDKDRARRPQTARELHGELEVVARAAGLSVSSLALQQLMERCFGSKIQVLREAQAQGNVELLSLVVDNGLGSEELDELPPSATAPLAPPDEEEPTRVATPAGRPALAPPVRSWRGAWLAGAALVGALAGVATFLLVRPSPLPVASPQGPIAPPVTAPPVTAPPVTAPPVTAPPVTAPPVTPPAKVATPKRSSLPLRPSEPKVVRRAAVPAGPTPRPAAPPTPRPAPPPDKGKGKLVLASSPWCRVAIDGVDRGPTPLRLDLPAGEHVVELTNAEFKISRRITVAIHANQTVRKSLDFGE